MGNVNPITSTCLNLTPLQIRVSNIYRVPPVSPQPSFYHSINAERDVSTKPLRLSKSLEPESNWINIGCPNSSEEAEDNYIYSPEKDRGQGGGVDHDLPPRKKQRLSKEQSRILEDSFRQNHTLNPKQKQQLAERLSLRARQVEVWFQNRRARSKLKQTERECEYLKRWFGSLTEQNRKLQKEIDDLRAVKMGQPIGFSARSGELTSASSLNMCPRCQRVSSNSTQLDKPILWPNHSASMSDEVADVGLHKT